jgi:NAD(P)-dependent dehydrogenase (short-subunit alcohol dehydrogenase family)
MQFKGKTALVTGSTSGIGLAAEAIQDDGSTLLCERFSDRKADPGGRSGDQRRFAFELHGELL